MSQYFANVAGSDGERDPVDRYETPNSVTEALLRRIDLSGVFEVREPCCGTGRLAHVLRDHGLAVFDTDLVEDGVDFLQDNRPCEAVVTNPPYRDGLAEAFVRHALRVTDGPVAMLLRTGFLNGTRRARGLFSDAPPTNVFYVSRRIRFFKADGTRISGQAHDHAWVVWRQPRAKALDWIMPDELYDAGS